MADDSANIVLYDPTLKRSEPLTRFAEPQNMSDVTWSRDGNWVVFVSAHDYVHSRNNERNVFIVGRDGTGLHMVTGDYADPSAAPGPYVILKGQVVGGEGPCLVCAQGVASPVTTDRSGAFELPGVPISATWARAVCQQEEYALQGDAELAIQGDSLAPITITVEAKGQGWTQASLSRDGRMLAGTLYRWALDEEGKRQYQMQGVLYDLQGTHLGKLDLLTDTTLIGLDWSPVADKLVGALTASKKTWLWLWDSAGRSLGPLVEIPNTEQEILSAANPAWSPDGKLVAFDLRRWYWWGENKYKTELMLVSATGEDLRTVVETDWGVEASHPCWMADGRGLFYQLVKDSTGSVYLNPTGGNIWSVAISPQATPVPWTEDGLSYLPACSPPGSPVPKPDILR
jgi:Tol biopolymer transport system component